MANEFKIKHGLISPNAIFQGATSGTVTVVPTAAAGTNTITLPAATGTVALASSALTSGRVPIIDGNGALTDNGYLLFNSGTGALTAQHLVANSTISGGSATITELNTLETTFNLVNDTAETINFGGAATTMYIGPPGSMYDSGNYWLFGGANGGSYSKNIYIGTGSSGGATNITLGDPNLGVNTTTINGTLVLGTTLDSGPTFGAFAPSTTLTLGYTGTAASTTNISTGAVANGTTRTINIGTGGAVGNITNINLGSSNGYTGVIETYRQLNVNSLYGILQMFGANSFNISGTSELRLVSSGTNAFVIGSVGNAAPVVLAVNSTEVLRVSSNNVKVKQIFTLDFGTVLGGIQTGLEIKGDAAYATNLRFKIAQNTGGENIGSPVGTFSGAIIDVEGDRALSIATNGTERIHIQGNGIVNIRASTASSSTSTGALIVAGGVGIGGNLNVGGDFTLTGNLTVNGTTTAVNSTVVTVDDPIFTLGGDTVLAVDDNKDRGIAFQWFDPDANSGDGAPRVGFFGFDDSTGYFTFIPNATINSEVISGTQGDIQATNFRGNLVGNVTGNVSGNAGTVTNGVYTTDTGTVTNAMLAGSIAAGKLTVTSANIIVGNASNVGAAVAMSGDITIDNAGATTIGSGKVTNAMLAGSIALTKLTSDTSTALGVGTLELGHASDTTLSRSSAGVLAVEGVVIPTISSTSTLTNKTLTSPTLSLPKFDISAAVSAAGSTQGTATALTTMINNVTTVAASTGVVLPTAAAGYIVIVRNGGANTLNVYPATGASINAGAANSAHSLPVGAMIQYVATSTTQWYTMSSTFA